MFLSYHYSRILMLVSGLIMMFSVLPVYAALDARFELDPQTLGASATSKKNVKSDRRPNRRRKVKSSATGAGKCAVHTSSAGGQALRLESPEAALSELEINSQLRQTWNLLLPPPPGGQKPIKFQSPIFSLALDPQRYPVYSAMDNDRILVDRNASIPPL